MNWICLLVLLAASCQSQKEHFYFKDGKHTPHAHWTYSGDHGPEHWGDLDKAYRIAKDGSEQSPIDIKSGGTKGETLPPLVFDYHPSQASIVNNGHTLQHNEPEGSTLQVGDDVYELVQYHAHTPSEHTIDGKRFAMELHLVHRNRKGEIAVVAVLVKSGRPNPIIWVLRGELPEKPGTEATLAGFTSPEEFLPKERGYYTYRGSLTTPPCTEGVRWFVLKTPIEAAEATLREIKRIEGANARPVQPLHGRTVKRTD